MFALSRLIRCTFPCCVIGALSSAPLLLADDAEPPKPAAVKAAPADKSSKPAVKAAIVIAPSTSSAPPAATLEIGESTPKSLREAAATHKQTAVIKVNGGGKSVRLDDFCLDKSGNVLALVSPAAPNGGGLGLIGDLLGGESKPKSDDKPDAKAEAEKTVGSEVRGYDANGKKLAQWPVGFVAEAINLAPDGTLVVGGNGKVARFDATGKKLAEGVSPQMEYIRKNADEMRERAKEQLESDKAMIEQQAKVFEDQLKILETKKPEELTPEEKLQKQQFAFQVKMFKTTSEAYKKRTVDEALAQVTARALKTHSICAGDKEVFIVCPAMAGYGFGVWRTTADFAEPKEIIKSLSGCCGQMDVQCHNGELFVSENSRHRVIRYDRDGKQIATFGKRDREGEGENFGGCCNPMNCCFTSTGDLYVAESNGAVKHFTPDGKYVGLVGLANVQPGCKNSCVAATADDSHLFYIDVQKHEIIVLTKSK